MRVAQFRHCRRRVDFREREAVYLGGSNPGRVTSEVIREGLCEGIENSAN